MSATLIRHDEPAITANIMTTPAAHVSARDPKPARMQDSHKKKIDKKSPEYLWKSLIAGGIAGCAVRSRLIITWQGKVSTDGKFTGKNSSGPS